MSAHNLSSAKWVKAQSTNFTGRGQATTNAAVLHAIIVNSNTSGSFRVGSGTLTHASLTFPMGTYTPATGTSVYLPFYETEFTNGIFIDVGGTINYTVIFNDLV